MSDLIVIRHGETEWSRTGQHTGRTDIPLTPRGEDQAKALAPWISGRTIARVFVSPLVRARRTAALAGLPIAGDAFVLEPDLQEWDYGGYEGLTTPEIQRRHAGWNLWRDGVVPGDREHPGESIEQVASRIDRVIARVRAALAEDRGDVVTVAHGHSLRTLGSRWLDQAPQFGARLRLDPAHVSVLGLEADMGVLRAWNLVPRST
ncbi:histidine phosphatase family protein [Pendulispora albinea]|uniref:Histidine phosphatase family protein n=1 Tax=Pendulispora albinea TaxID=2741071 RepID=A0ABZ2LUT0_9BACT